MADGASIGSVYVEVSPDTTGFWTKFQAQTRPGAGKAGDDIGGALGKSIADAIAKGIRDGLGKGTEGSPAREPGRKTGEEFSGEFERIVKTRIAAALRSLPTAKITADSSEADRKIAAIRTEMEGLRDARIGVDLTSEEAIAKLRELNERLTELATRSPNVQVSADTARAAAEIAAVGEEIRAIAGAHPTVTVDADTGGAEAKLAAVDASARNAGGGVSALVAAGIAIGPAIIPGAAAAAAAIAAIGPAALGAAGGVGVVALAVSGVVGAVKAMGAANDQAGQSAVSLAGKQSQIAAAADQVRSAEASLANTRAAAADSARRAAESVTNAERSLSDAQINANRANAQATQQVTDAEATLTRAERDALTAEQNLTQAREDAKRANEDLTNQLIDNGFAQQHATLAVADAQKQLQAVMASPLSTARQRTEAQLAFAEAKQHLVEIGEQQQRLTADKAKADKAGIDGSKQVVAAQAGVLNSQDAVRKAEEGVAKARADAANTARTSAESVAKAQQAVGDAQAAQATQARQSAFSIAQAQQGVVNAQRAVQQASVSAGTAGGAAMNKLQQAMAALSPEGQRFAAFIYGLKEPLLDLRRTAEAGLLPGLQSGIEALLPILPNVKAAVGAFASEMGHLFQAAGQALASPFWQDFFQFTVSTAIPALDNAAHVAGNFAIGLAALYRAFVPLGQNVGAGLLNFSREFAAHALTLQNTAGYRDFLDYVRTEGPIVAQTVGQVVEAAVRLVQAIAPLGGGSLTAIRLLAETINALPVGVLTVLAGGIGGVVLASKGLSFVKDAWFSAFGTGFVQIMTNARIAMQLAADEGAGKLTTAFSGLRAAGGTLASMLGAGGLVGVGLAAATAGIIYFSEQSAKQKQRVDDLVSSLNALGQAYAKNHDLSDQSVKDIITHNDQLSDLVRNNDAYGVSVDLVARAAQGDKAAQQQVIQALQAKKAAILDAGQAANQNNTATDESIKKSVDQYNAIDALIPALNKQFAATNSNADVSAKLNAAQAGAAGSAAAATQSSADFTANLRSLQTALSGTKTTTSEFDTALTAIGNTAGGAAEKSSVLAVVSGQVAASQLSASDKAKEFTTILGQMGTATSLQSPQFTNLATAFSNIATSELSASDKATLLKQALQQLYGGVISQNEATEALAHSQDALTTQTSQNTAGFDLNTAKAGQNREAVLANRDALETALTAVRDKYTADIAAGTAEDVARAAHDKATTSILNQIDPAHRNTAAVKGLVDEYGAIPPYKSTEVSTPGLSKAISDLIEAHAVQEGLSAHPPWDKATIEGEARSLGNSVAGRAASFADKLADGGQVGGWSPHPKADNIPAWLTAKEFVQPVASVDYYGVGLMEALRTRSIPREMFAAGGLVPRFADGGLAKWPIEIDTDLNTGQLLAGLWSQWNQARAASAAAAAGGGFTAGAIPGQVTQNVMGWIRAAVQIAGAPASWVGGPGQIGLYTLVMRESGGNPSAINLCVPLDSLILTKRGWLKHDEVQVGDETIGYNPATQRSEWTRVTAVHHYGESPIVEIGNERWSVRCTPNHRWINEPKIRDLSGFEDQCPLCEWPNMPPPPPPLDQCPECGWKPKAPGGVPLHRRRKHGIVGANASGNRVERFRRRGKTTDGGLFIHLAKAHGVNVDHEFTYGHTMTAAADLTLTGYARIRVSADTDTGNGLPITDDEAELLGWILGDGHVEKPARGRGGIQIGQSKPRGLVALRELADRLGVRHSWYITEPKPGWKAKQTVHTLRFGADYAADLLARSGYTGHVQMVINMSAGQRHAFLRGVIHAEGTSQSTGGDRGGDLTVIPQKYGAKHDAIKLAVFMCGYRPSVSDRSAHDIPQGWAPVGVIGTCKPHITPLFRRDAGTTDVWCVTTELGTWTAEQDGQIFLTGNSDSNAKAGHPSIGLAQTIGPTFEAYRDKRLPDNIRDPVANLVAAIHYIQSRYHHLPQQANPFLPPLGYDSGGYLPPGLTLAYNGTGQPETIRTAEQEAALARSGGGHTFNVYPSAHMSEYELAKTVQAEVAWQNL